MKPNLGFLGLVDWELCHLEVGQFSGQLLASLTTVQWCQVAQGNTRDVPRRYRHHILQHIGHWMSFGYNWWRLISGPWLRSVLGVALRSPIWPCVQGCQETPPENEQNPYIQGRLLAPMGVPKNFKYFFHMVIIWFNLIEVKIFECIS